MIHSKYNVVANDFNVEIRLYFEGAGKILHTTNERKTRNYEEKNRKHFKSKDGGKDNKMEKRQKCQ